MVTVGIDIGGRGHVVARCRDGKAKADREVLRVSQSRAGFAALDGWLERQAEPVSLVTMESSGHYWMPLASHLRRSDVPVAVVNPLAAKYFAKSRLARTKSDPADARSLAEMAMRDPPPARSARRRRAASGRALRDDPRDRAGQGLPAPRAAGRARLPGARRALRGPHLPDRPRGPPDRAHRERGDVAGGRRRWPTPTPGRVVDGSGGPGRSGCRPPPPTRSPSPSSTPRWPSRSGLLLDQYDLLERQIEAADARVASLLDGELARRLQTIPGVGPAIVATLLAEIGDIERFDDFDQLLAYRRRPPRRAQLGAQGLEPRDRLAHVEGRQQPPPCRRLPDRRRGHRHNPVIAAHYRGSARPARAR